MTTVLLTILYALTLIVQYELNQVNIRVNIATPVNCELVGNEIADQFANDAVRLDIDPPFFPFHYYNLNPLVKKLLIQK